MPELNIEKLKTPEIKKNETEKLGDKDIKNHDLATSYVGFPGQEKLVSETLNGDQVEVSFIKGGEIPKLKKDKILSFEQQIIDSQDNKDVLKKGEDAKETVGKSKKEAADIADLAALLSSHEFLIVNPKGVENKGNYDYYFLMTKKNKDKVQNEFKKLGYIIVDNAEEGFLVSSELTKMYFLYGKESQQPNKAEEKN